VEVGHQVNLDLKPCRTSRVAGPQVVPDLK
jgi:hypothetical protein